jgi:hypothetical protein
MSFSLLVSRWGTFKCQEFNFFSRHLSPKKQATNQRATRNIYVLNLRLAIL